MKMAGVLFESRGAVTAVPVNAFFAIKPAEPARAQIAGLARHLHKVHKLRGNPILPEHLHVTLHPVGDERRGMKAAIGGAMDAAGRVRASPFDVVFDVAESFFVRSGNHPFVLRGCGLGMLTDFRRELGAEMVRSGLKACVVGNFTPHVTMLWADRCVEEHPVAPIRWTVREFVLVLSLVGWTEHRHVGRWPLQG